MMGYRGQWWAAKACDICQTDWWVPKAGVQGKWLVAEMNGGDKGNWLVAEMNGGDRGNWWVAALNVACRRQVVCTVAAWCGAEANGGCQRQTEGIGCKWGCWRQVMGVGGECWVLEVSGRHWS